MPGKQDTFVLDFVNSAEDIRKAFEPYYEETVLEEETNPNVIYDLKNTLDEYRVYQQAEIDRFARFSMPAKHRRGAIWADWKAPFARRWTVSARWKRKSRICSSQPWRGSTASMPLSRRCGRLFDREIHKFSVYAKFLASLLPKGGHERYRWTTRCFWSTTGWKRTTKAPLS